MKKLHTPAFFLLVMLSVFITTLSAQPAAQRLVGYRANNFSNTTPVLNDSFSYTYSNGRGSINRDNLAFDQRTEITDVGNYGLVLSQFDANSNLVQMNIKTAVNGNWVDAAKLLQTFNASNRLTSMIQQQYYNNTFYNIAKLTYTYNSYNDTLQYASYATDTAFNFVMSQRTDYAYDNQHRHTEDVYYNLTPAGAIRDTNERDYYTYDAFGNLAMKQSDLQDTTFLTKPWRKNEYAYDTAHLLQNSAQSYYTNGYWVPDYNKVYYYNTAGKLREEREFVSDGHGGLQGYYEYMYSYNNAGLMDTSWWYDYNAQTVDFYLYSRNVYYYDANDNLLKNERNDLDTTTWTAVQKTEYEYNNFNNCTRKLFSYGNGVDYAPNEEELFYYQNYTLPTGIETVDEASISIYPNPAHDYLKVNIAPATFNNLRLVDLNGQVIIEQPINETASHLNLNTAVLSAGTYLVQLTGEITTVSKKIVIQ